MSFRSVVKYTNLSFSVHKTILHHYPACGAGHGNLALTSVLLIVNFCFSKNRGLSFYPTASLSKATLF